MTVGGVAAAVGAIIAVLVSFGVDLTEGQIKAILGLVLIGGPLLVAVFIRAKVWSPASVARAIAAERAAKRSAINE